MTLIQKVKERLDNLTKPVGSLGYLEDIVIKFAEITGKDEFKVPLRKVVFVFCGDHGVVEEGVSAYPQQVTMQMIYNFLRGGAAINVIARQVGADVFVVDVGTKSDIDEGNIPPESRGKYIKKKINYGTRNFVKEPAMSDDEAMLSIKVGEEMAEFAVRMNYDLVIPGDMGIGNTTPSSAIISFVTEQPPERVVGRGTGIDDSALKKKISVVSTAIQKWKPHNALSALRYFGGYEIGAIAGLILTCVRRNIPVVVDGLISLAGFCIAYSIDPKVKDKVFFGHKTAEPGGGVALSYFGIRPILDLDMRLGEGTGGALASAVIETALRIYNEMATFSSAGVSKSKSN